MKSHRNERGITLVELLAVIAISSIVILLIITLHIYVQKQFHSQSEDAFHLTDVTIVAKEITKEIRKSDVISDTSPRHWIEFSNDTTYELVGDVLHKDDIQYIFDVDEFIIIEDAGTISLMIKSKTGQKVETTLTIR